MCTREPRLVLVSLLIGWKSGVITFNQSLREVIIDQSNSLITFDTQLKTALFDSVYTVVNKRDTGLLSCEYTGILPHTTYLLQTEFGVRTVSYSVTPLTPPFLTRGQGYVAFLFVNVFKNSFILFLNLHFIF